MSTPGYLVIRLVPDSPVDPISFSTYLLDLQITINDAASGNLLGQTPVNSAPVVFWGVPSPGGPTSYEAAFMQLTSADAKSGDTSLALGSTVGIPIGALPLMTTSQSPFPANTKVSQVSSITNSVTLDTALSAGLFADTGVYFIYTYPSSTITNASGANPSFSFTAKTNKVAASGATVLKFAAGNTAGVATGMAVTGTNIDNGTTVLAADTQSVTLSKPLLAGGVASGATITFTGALSAGIVQHSQPYTEGPVTFTIPASVATAVVELNLPTPPPTYLNIKPVITRSGTKANEIIRTDAEFYNVIVELGNPGPLFTYPSIPLEETTFYVTLPPPPNTDAISLILPKDGSAPPFDLLLAAMTTAMTNDPTLVPSNDLSALSPDQCTSMASDIVWSAQNTLPLPPDPLETLYTNPPNPGGVGGGSNNNNGDEQDRQKFEGTLKSFYSTRNADAVRLAKFVAAASAALYCEQKSVAAPQALLEFPVDPTDPNVTPNPSPVESEVLLTDLSNPGINFGVPAAFFYALGVKMDKNATGDQRYRMACGDAIERVLQEFGDAAIAGAVGDSERYSYPLPTPPAPNTNPQINSAQAARRLSALRVTIASTTPSVPLPAAGPLTSLVNAWLAYPPPGPPPTYQSYNPSDDNGNWAALVVKPPIATPVVQAGFLQLVLGALTHAYMIPASGGNPAAPLADKITAFLAVATPNPTVDRLKAVTASAWATFFATAPADLSWIPLFLQPGNAAGASSSKQQQGYLAQCVKLFIRNVQKFFTVSSVVNPAPAVVPGLPGNFGLPDFDAISQAVANLPASFVRFGNGPLAAADITAAVQSLGPPPLGPEAQAWLEEAIATINELYQIAGVVSEIAPNAQPVPGSLRFSVMEALYARGFRSAKDITDLSTDSFQQALTGTVAYAYAVNAPPPQTKSLYDAASALAPPSTPSNPAGGAFTPVNPDGTLTNCIPPPCLSPFGLIAYLKELIQLAQSSTCETPLATFTVLATTQDALPGSTTLLFASPTTGLQGMWVSGPNIPGNTTVSGVQGATVTLSLPTSGPVPQGTNVGFTTADTLNAAISARRGPVDQLAATCSNCETPLPLIDIVNECLEFMASSATKANGIVYDTARDRLAGHKLCEKDGCETKPDEDTECHQAAALFAALPEHSTPATPGKANAAVEPAVFDLLAGDFSSCCLPYAQALDVNRTYLRHFGSCRYEVMRTFRRCITEFVLDPAHEPGGFQSYLWRYPVRIDTAIEYLGISPEEYVLLFNGAWPKPCGGGDGVDVTKDGTRDVKWWQLYGFASERTGDTIWTQVALQLPEFLARTCLTYCEFLELSKCGCFSFSNGGGRTNAREGGVVAFPDCEPCCLQKFSLRFPSSERDPEHQQALFQLAVFIRLWRKLKDLCGAGYSFAELCDICDVLHLFNATDNTLNPDFIRQLAAFQILRDQLHLRLSDPDEPPAPGAKGAERTHLLALWAGTGAAKWPWAVKQMLAGVERLAQCRHQCERRPPEFLQRLACHLDPLSQLAGFNPAVDTTTSPATDDRWQAVPTHTLRFAEILAKLYASSFHLDEIFYLFTVGKPGEGWPLFPLQEEDEALESPLSLPDDEHEYSLWKLRHKLLETRVSDDDVHHWSWNKIESSLREEFGFAASDLLAFGQHFFPATLQAAGYLVDAGQRRYSTQLTTTAQTWGAPPVGPFQYDAGHTSLWTQLPLSDAAVIGQLERLQQLTTAEQQAVQDLYFQPRKKLAAFAFLFTDFVQAQHQLIEEPEEDERWRYFRRQFALCHARCRILAEHLAHHVACATGHPCPEGASAAFLVMRELLADENWAATDWQADPGTRPSVTWSPPPLGGAFAALLGLTGTGLLREFVFGGGTTIAWRDVSGPLSAFGQERDHENCPVPTVLPSLGFGPAPSANVTLRNGLAADAATGAWLGGAQGFTVKWTGALLIDAAGRYEFRAGAPTPDCEEPSLEAAEGRQWRVTLKRGQKTWLVLNHHWVGETGQSVPCVALKRGTYDLCVEFLQPSPTFLGDKPRRQHTGFQVKYTGPDTEERLMEIPQHRLFRAAKEMTQVKAADGTPMWQDLGYGIGGLLSSAADFLNGYYTSSLRDIRGTYQRAFKALLFVHRFGLAAGRDADAKSELGYMLGHAANFAGLAFYRGPSQGGAPGAFHTHTADFDFNFLPLQDDYYPPSVAQDARMEPLAQRTQALFDWWERVFDYDQMRREIRPEGERHLWLLFQEAADLQPTDPGSLLRHLGAEPRHWPSDLRYYQEQTNAPYAVTSADLEDDRWLVRAWRADRWLAAVHRRFTVKNIAQARPDLWASLAPDRLVVGQTVTGNANLSQFLCDGSLENREPCRYTEVKELNDGLRERGRCALVSYLCGMNRVTLPWGSKQFARVPGDLSAVLLLDVETGICEKASRIEEAITAVQNFVRRARLSREPGWTVTHDFALLWDRRFATFRVWEACKRREVYKENWVDWEELEHARRIEAFRFLEDKLRSASLTIAEPAGGDWWPDQHPPAHRGLVTLQANEPSWLEQLPSSPPTPEGWTMLGTPEAGARPSWLAAPSPTTPSNPNPNGSALPTTGEGPRALASRVAQSGLPSNLPFWLESAVRLGAQLIRVAAAGRPAASADLVPHRTHRHAGCCAECGCVHPPLVDEYYFWLVESCQYVRPDNDGGTTGPNPLGFQFGVQDPYYDQTQQQSVAWNDTSQLPSLLHWPSRPAVRLAWCRVHNGEFSQPRRSVESVAITSAPSLQFLGRGIDSLYFSVGNAVPAPNGYTDKSPPGFRYDLPTDDAVALPLPVSAASPTPPVAPGALPAYPFFAFDWPGSRLFPNCFFAPALVVADALRIRCRFDLALKWYERAFAPLLNDCTWSDCTEKAQPDANPTGGLRTADGTGGACCDSTDVSDEIVRNRAVLLHYCETLLDWGNHLLRRRPVPEAFQQARLIFDTIGTILGRRPQSVMLKEPPTAQPVVAFTPAFPSLNPRLLELYDHTADRLGLIHACTNGARLPNGRPDLDMPYFGDDPAREGWRTASDACADETDWCLPHSPYRFLFLIQKAREHAGAVRELGSALLSCHEKGDAEYLAFTHAAHERELQALTLAIQQDQWRDADWQIQALQQTKDLNQTNLIYYTNLYNNGLINDENQHQVLATTAMMTRTGASTVQAVGEAMKVIPDLFIGFPCNDAQIPIGTKLAGLFETIGKVMSIFADIQSETAALDLTLAGWQRRSDEWLHQTQTLPIDIERIEFQILGLHRQRAKALHELNNLERRFEQSTEVLNFLRQKFSAEKLYLWMQKETCALHHKMYELAWHSARQTERAFHFECGHTTRRFIPDCAWDTLHDGLLAGERLEFALRHMEKAYLDLNVREYELTKHFSLRLHFPKEFLRLRLTGRCEIEIPEWMFDLDYPGHYLRRIKNVTVTIPCVAGPYNGVHCRLTLFSSQTRIDPSLIPPAKRCCHECKHDSAYEACRHDPRVVRQYAAREAIATSSGQNDSGLFELNFRDDRYLPFEFHGAVCHLRIDLPPENNCFDLDILNDFIIHLNHTACEGGEPLREAANQAAQKHLPGSGWTFFDVRHDFPDAWELFRNAGHDNHRAKQLNLKLTRNLFPFIPGHRELWVDKMVLLFETPDRPASECCAGGECACPENKMTASYKLKFIRGKDRRPGDCEGDEAEFCCVASEDWPELYYGVVEERLGPVAAHDGCQEARFRFPPDLCEVSRVFLFFHYEVKPAAACDPRTLLQGRGASRASR